MFFRTHNLQERPELLRLLTAGKVFAKIDTSVPPEGTPVCGAGDASRSIGGWVAVATVQRSPGLLRGLR